MPPYASGLKRKGSSKRGTAKRIAGLVRKSYVNMPVYNTVATAPAPTRVELKYDFGEFSQLMKSAGLVTLLSTVATGSGSNERIGKRIQYQDIEIGWHYRPNALFNGNKVQFLIVFDKQPNGTLPAYSQICQSTAVEAFANNDTRGRFKILYRTEHIATNNTNGYSDHQGAWTGRKIISLKGMKAEYTGTGNAISDIERGAIYLVTQSYGNDLVLLEFVNRIQFSDA